jgi:hypothetical protein
MEDGDEIRDGSVPIRVHVGTVDTGILVVDTADADTRVHEVRHLLLCLSFR